MISLIEEKRQGLSELCARYSVKRLELFGSAADGTFKTGHSDLDFLVEFGDIPDDAHADHYFGLWYGLRDLFDMPVDLVVASVMRNPYFIAAVNQSRTMVYDAAA